MNSLTVVFNALPAILAGSFVTIGNVTASLAMGLVLGVPLAVGQVYGGPWLRRLVALYVWFFRGVPILVLLVHQLGPACRSLSDLLPGARLYQYGLSVPDFPRGHRKSAPRAAQGGARLGHE